jgi:hypothetical protein
MFPRWYCRSIVSRLGNSGVGCGEPERALADKCTRCPRLSRLSGSQAPHVLWGLMTHVGVCQGVFPNVAPGSPQLATVLVLLGFGSQLPCRPRETISGRTKRHNPRTQVPGCTPTICLSSIYLGSTTGKFRLQSQRAYTNKKIFGYIRLRMLTDGGSFARGWL